jgi:hypothetical protein
MSAIEQVERYLEARTRELGGHERALEQALGSELHELELIRVSSLVADALDEAGDAARERFFERMPVSMGGAASIAAVARRTGLDGALQRALASIADAAAPRP